ncbi:ParA-like family protein (ATPase) (plasmid) [Desulforapulum autotrophicum HRM2]|uniref:ParA-like family protein (ATPase) n=1 Tax=Desulforapulum autotrophicum (strain ATCC 43914 / DSM 3382 / VKM B-1955 / HRM2) TaxID=177437 RepID=C0QMK1_DESAH|nr:AAA family ATPase [Desulforapulum autotrophicum]ACN17995.1 ParA-like family protein (ATPase) [Desulforapulum autotrophicum HRM2]
MNKKECFIGSISNYKGGTGKTITAVNLSAGLAIQKKKVLIIDIDPQSDTTRALMQDPMKINNCIYQLLDPGEKQPIDLKDCIYSTIHENLDILPNITETSGLEIPLAINFPESNWNLRNKIYDYVKDKYDYALIDCPPTLSIFVSNALYASDFVMIPVDAGSGNSLEGVKGVLELMQSVRDNGNPNLRFIKILINKIDRRKSAHKANIQEAQNRFGEENIFETTIPTSSVFETIETMRKTSVFSYSPTSKGAQGFRTFTKEFLSFFEPERSGE